ncbi:hypothetical protein DFAR_3500011 [Desulfarculales bacterium]
MTMIYFNRRTTGEFIKSQKN